MTRFVFWGYFGGGGLFSKNIIVYMALNSTPVNERHQTETLIKEGVFNSNKECVKSTFHELGSNQTVIVLDKMNHGVLRTEGTKEKYTI